MTSVAELLGALRAFNAEREWERFHTPKNLAMGLLVEAAEVAEHFQWLTEEESRNLSPDTVALVREEIGDVLLYLLNLSDKLGIDVLDAARSKLETNGLKYPADKARGRADKHTEYRSNGQSEGD